MVVFTLFRLAHLTYTWEVNWGSTSVLWAASKDLGFLRSPLSSVEEDNHDDDDDDDYDDDDDDDDQHGKNKDKNIKEIEKVMECHGWSCKAMDMVLVMVMDVSMSMTISMEHAHTHACANTKTNTRLQG